MCELRPELLFSDDEARAEQWRGKPRFTGKIGQCETASVDLTANLISGADAQSIRFHAGIRQDG